MTIAERTRPAEMSAILGQLPTKPLKDKTALVTGSTSGIGLGIARALAQAGCNIVLNGFGESREIERERAQIAGDFGVGAAFDGADLAKPAEIVRMIEASDARIRQGRHPRQQCWYPTHGANRRVPHRSMGRGNCDKSIGKLSHDACRHSANAGAQLGPYYQYRFHARFSGVSRKSRLRRRKARGCRIDQSSGA